MRAMMDINTLRVAVTVTSLLVFLAIWAWAYSGRNKSRFDALARAVLDDDELRAGGRP